MLLFQSVKPADENKKTKTGIYLFILILIAVLAISLVAVATLSTFLFLIDDNSDDDRKHTFWNCIHYCCLCFMHRLKSISHFLLIAFTLRVFLTLNIYYLLKVR